MKRTLGVVISLFLLSLSAGVQAAVKCQASNGRGDAWYAVSEFRSEARNAALRACRTHSVHRHRCHLDFCHFIRGHHDRYDRHHNRHHRDGIRFDIR